MKKTLIILAAIFFITYAFFSFCSADEGVMTGDFVSSENATLHGEQINYTTYESNQSNSLLNSKSGKIKIIGMNPINFEMGNVQFAVQIFNDKDARAENVIALITGEGYSTSSMNPIDSLDSGSKGYLLVYGNFAKSGMIALDLLVDNQHYFYNVSVREGDDKKADSSRKEELERFLGTLKQNYTFAEKLFNEKQDSGFDVGKIHLDDSKKMIRNAESLLLTGKVVEAEAEISLANEELTDQVSKLEMAGKKSIVSKIKENAVVFSTIAGAIIAFFTLFELLKKKSSNVVNKVKEVKINIIRKD